MMPTPAELLRDRRVAHGLTQAQLALRAGTSQAAISRIEGAEVSPTFSTLAGLLGAMGETLSLDARPAVGDFDLAHLAANLARSPAERLELGIHWNRLGGEVARAGARARGG